MRRSPDIRDLIYYLLLSALVLALTAAACSQPTQTAGGTTPLPQNPTPIATPTASQTSTQPPVSSSATPQSTAAILPVTTTPPDYSHPRKVVFSTNLSSPDDLLLAPKGAVLVSDVSDGAVGEISLDGQVRILISGLSEPEGMVFLPDGSLVIAEQGKNRLVRWDPQSKLIKPILDLPNPSGRLGVDGIALDARPGNPPSLIIPDSPNGTVLRASVDGKTTTIIARVLNRPTGAWVEPDGSILVVEENGGRLDRIHPDGSMDQVARLSTPDDVIEDPFGNIFVATLGDGAIHNITSSGNDTVLADGLSSPQGLAFDSNGDLLVTDPGKNRILKLAFH